MHLSNAIQKRLDGLNSIVKLASTIDGIFPDKYSFYNKSGRSFRTEFASTNKEFSIVLFERTEALNYENCFARGLFADLDRLAAVIDLWVAKHADIDKLSKQFPELELFTPFTFKHNNPDIEAAWIKVKNMIFNSPHFWKDYEWNDRYEIMLIEAKKHKSFEALFPLTSHYNLRFSIDKDMKESWAFYYSVVPSFDKTKGNYCVTVSIQHSETKYFDDIHEALGFYAELLSKIQPTKWR